MALSSNVTSILSIALANASAAAEMITAIDAKPNLTGDNTFTGSNTFSTGTNTFSSTNVLSGATSIAGGTTARFTTSLAIGGALPTNPQAQLALIPAANASGVTASQSYSHMDIAPSGAVTIPAGTAPIVASLSLHEPNITATGTVTAAATLYIADAPTEGGGNYALFVDSGVSRFDGNLEFNATAAALVGARRVAGTTAVTITGAGQKTLSLNDSGGIFAVTQNAAYDIDLPSPTTGPGLEFIFYLTGPAANSVTITVAGSAATFVGTIVNDVTSVVPATGSTLTFASGSAALGDTIIIRSISTGLYHVQAVSSTAGGITIA